MRLWNRIISACCTTSTSDGFLRAKFLLASYFCEQKFCHSLRLNIEDNIWWLKVTFLNDLFEKLNNPNLSLKGAKENIITISCKLQAFKENIDVWIKKAENKNKLTSCQASMRHRSRINYQLRSKKTLQNLQATILKYFPSLETQQYEWVLNPFIVQDISVLSMIEQENLIDIRNDMIHKNEFAEKELTAFWMT